MDLRLATPSGIRDWGPKNAWVKRELESRLINLFRLWGYSEVVTGTIEYEQTIAKGLSEEEKDQLYRFFGREGEILTLRHDMTTPIARLVSSQLKDAPSPIRLFYISNVFRYEGTQAGKYREFNQAGIELIGTNAVYADVEIILLAHQAVKSLGLHDFKIGIGQIQLLDALLKVCDLDGSVKAELKKAVADKDFVTFENLMDESEVKNKDREILNSLLRIYSKDQFINFVDNISEYVDADSSFTRIKNLLDILESSGLGEDIFIDLGITRDFEYYTGMVFEVYAPSLGFPICGGGRYNNLLQQFGFECPATGFALGIERILLVLEKLSQLPEKRITRYIIGGNDINRVLRRAKDMRDQGYYVEIDVDSRNEEELKKCGELKNAAVEYIN